MNEPKYGINALGIYKSYHKKQVLSDVTLSVPYGKIYGLLGPSGCGKTTLVKIIAGILRADQGKALIRGKEMPSFDIMSNIGYMAQSAALYPTLTGYENLEFFGQLYGVKKRKLSDQIHHVSRLVNLTEDLDKRTGDYSGGMKQRLSLAIALLPNPSVLILDEPTVGIDPLLRQEIWRELYHMSDQGVTILVTTHVMDEARKCHALAMMREGQILATGSPEEIQQAAGATTLEDAFIHFTLPSGGDHHEN